MKAYLTFTIIILCTMISIGQSVYDYPIKGGTDQWRELKNHSEMVAVCQIPDSLLTVMNTNDLLKTCLEYPLLGDIRAYHNAQDGIDAYKRTFNGINEFFSRPDCYDAIKKIYFSIDPANINEEWTLVEKGDFEFQIRVIELLLCQEEVMLHLSTDQKKHLVQTLLENKNAMIDKEVYGGVSHMAVYFAVTRILLSEDIPISLSSKELNDLQEFAERGNHSYRHLSSRINELALDFIN